VSSDPFTSYFLSPFYSLVAPRNFEQEGFLDFERLIGNLTPLTEVPASSNETLTLALDAPASVIAEAEAIVATAQEEEKRAGGRPRKHKERLHIKVSSEVAAYLRSLKGEDDGYSGYLETLVQCDPRFRACTQQPTELSDISCV
jgi:hypothetical protein